MVIIFGIFDAFFSGIEPKPIRPKPLHGERASWGTSNPQIKLGGYHVFFAKSKKFHLSAFAPRPPPI